VRLVDVPTTGDTGELRREQVKMVINYWRQSENAAAYSKILGIDAQRHPLMSIFMLLKGDLGPMSTKRKPQTSSNPHSTKPLTIPRSALQFFRVINNCNRF